MTDMPTQMPLVSPTPIEGTLTDIQVAALVGKKSAKMVGPKPEAAFRRSVEQFGILQPILVVRHGEGKLEVRDGRRRLRTALELEKATIPAYVVDAKGWHDSILGAVANEQRSENGAATLAVIEEIEKAGGTEQDIFEATGIPKGRIRKLQKITLRLNSDGTWRSGLIVRLRTAYDDGAITQEVAFGAAKLDETTQNELADLLAEKGKLTWVDVASRRKAKRDTAQGALELDLDDEGDAGWTQYVQKRLREAQNACPNDEAGNAIRDMIGTLISDVIRVGAASSEAQPEPEPEGASV